MADSNFVLARGYLAAAAITKNRAVKLSAAETVTPNTGVADVTVGVAEFGVSAAEIAKGKTVTVHHAGIVQMEAAGAITIGALVASATDGRAQAAVTTNRVIGICVGNPAVGAGEVVSVLLGLPGNII